MIQDDNFVLTACFFFWWTGTIFHLFQLSGKILEFKELQNTFDNGFTIIESFVYIA